MKLQRLFYIDKERDQLMHSSKNWQVIYRYKDNLAGCFVWAPDEDQNRGVFDLPLSLCFSFLEILFQCYKGLEKGIEY